MKKVAIIVLCFQFLVMAGSCQKPVPPKPNTETVDNTKLSIVWSKNFYLDSVSAYFLDPIFAGNYIVYASEGDDKREANIRVFNKLTGEPHSAWQHTNGLIDRADIDGCVVGGNNQNTVFTTNQLELYAFDIQTGQRLWKKAISSLCTNGYGTPNISTMGRFVLQNYGPGALSKSWYRISAFDPLTGQERIITQLNIRDNFEFDISPPAWTINAVGDTLLLFATGGVNFSTNGRLIDAYCYNVTQRKIEWHQKDLTPDGISSGTDCTPIITENNTVIFQGFSSIHCFNISTGEQLWHYDKSWQEGYSSLYPFLYYKGKLLVRGGSGILYCYDAQTGNLLWQNSAIQAIPCPQGRMDAYNDKWYFTAWRGSQTGVLYCVSIATGEIEWSEVRERGKIVFGVLIDQQTGYLYCSTAWSIMCVDLNKTPKK